MTPRERWLAVLEHRLPDRVPLDYWGTPEITEKLIQHLSCSTRQEMLKKLHVDYVVHLGARYRGPQLPADTDIFGVRVRNVAVLGGEYPETIFNPLAGYQSLTEIEANYTWPNLDIWDFGVIPDQLAGSEEYIVQGGGSEPFLTYKDLRGQEQAMIDLVEHPDIVEYCLEKLFDLSYGYTQRILETARGRVDLCYIAEDLGGQRNLLFSPAHIRRFLFPGMRRMIELTHSAGARVFHHDDGNLTRILPELVDLGIDLLNPLQWRADGMDRAWLKSAFGDRVVLHGAMDNQYTLPFGTLEQVRQEVRDNLRILGAGGGYILAPCHNLQPITPVENVLAMYQTAYDEGWY
jgi:uroporphyrinogen decarboxylase